MAMFHGNFLVMNILISVKVRIHYIVSQELVKVMDKTVEIPICANWRVDLLYLPDKK